MPPVSPLHRLQTLLAALASWEVEGGPTGFGLENTWWRGEVLT